MMKTRSFVVLAILVWLACAAAPLHHIFSSTNISTYYSENLAYRYFGILKLVDGAGEFVSQGQGPLLGIFQRLIYKSIAYVTPGDPTEALVRKINLFGYGTYLLNLTVLLFGLQAIVRSRVLNPLTKLAVMSMPLLYGFSYAIGFAYLLYPDYAASAQALFVMLVFAVATLPRGELEPPESVRGRYRTLALATGFASALKINYGFFPAIYFFFHVFTHSRSRWRDFLEFLGISTLTYAVLLFVFYDFSLRNSIESMRILFEFVGTLPGDPSFLKALLTPFASWSENSCSIYWWALAAAAPILFFSLLDLRRPGNKIRWSDGWAIIAGIFSISFYTASMIKRGGGASFMDTMLVLFPAAALAANQVQSDALRRRLLVVTCLVSYAFPLAWAGFHFNSIVTNLGTIEKIRESDELARGRWNDSVHNWVKNHELDVFLLMPSNQFIVGTVEDMMMRGLSHFWGPWSSSNENPTRQKLFPRYHFISYDTVLPTPATSGGRSQGVTPKDYVLVWTEPQQPGIGLVSVDEARIHRTYLETHGITQLEKGDTCRIWKEQMSSMWVKACVVRFSHIMTMPSDSSS